MEQSVPEALFTTDSTERGPGNAVDTGAASAERRSPRRKACPTTVSNIEELLSMRSSLSESRVSAFPRFLGSKGLPEHRRPLAREGSPGVSSIQSQEDRRLRCRRASSRRDPHVRGQQKDTELGLRYDRGLVSALAIDGDGKAKLPEHSRSVSRPFEALLHGPEQIADLPVPVAESPGAVRIGHPERSHLVEYLAPNSVFNSLPRQRSSPHLRPDDRLVTIDRVLHHASLGVA